MVHVTAEVAKPEDTQAISTARAAGHPVLAVLSKADLVGSLSGRGGRRRGPGAPICPR